MSKAQETADAHQGAPAGAFRSRLDGEGTEAPEWAPIAEWPEYEITRKGDIRRRAAARGTRPGRVIKQTKGNHGYKALGAKFGVPWGTIRNIVTRRTWLNV